MGLFASERLELWGRLVHLGARAGSDLLKSTQGVGGGDEESQSVLPYVKCADKNCQQWGHQVPGTVVRVVVSAVPSPGTYLKAA